jgi:hydroxyacylglutathione hydrolase
MSAMTIVVSDAIWRVARLESARPWSVNTWIVVAAQEGAAAVVDPGADPEAVRESLHALDATPAVVALTHGHHDHVVHLEDVCEAFGLDGLVSGQDRRLVGQAAMFGLRFAGRVIRTPKRLASFPDDGFVRLGVESLRVISAPGHTPGSIVLQSDSFAITGDTILREKVGRTDLPGGDRAALRRTVDALIESWADTIVLCPGHGAEWTAGEARRWWSAIAGNPPALTEFEA